MSDTMQFVRELLEGKSPNHAIQGTVTHVIRLYSPEPTDPIIYEFQMEVNGFLYCDFGCTRDPSLHEMQTGDEIIASLPAPETEGYPTFLLLAKAPAIQQESVSVAIEEEETIVPPTPENIEEDAAPFDVAAHNKSNPLEETVS